MGPQANIMCSSVWYKHPLLPGGIILPLKKTALNSCCQCDQMRPPQPKTGRYEHDIMTALCARMDMLAPWWLPCWVDYDFLHSLYILQISKNTSISLSVLFLSVSKDSVQLCVGVWRQWKLETRVSYHICETYWTFRQSWQFWHCYMHT